MDDIIRLFDSLLTLMVSFPVTIFEVLISPDKVVGMEASTLISPPGATLVISFIIWYLAHSMQAKIRYAHILPSMPEKEYAMRVFVLVIFVLLIQYLILLIPFVLPKQPVDAIKIVKALSYPVSVIMTINGLVYLIYIIFPIGSKPHGMTIEERHHKILRKMREESGIKRIVIDQDAGFLALLAGILVYVYAQYNVVRSLFQLSFSQSIIPTIVLLVGTFLVMILFSMYMMFVPLDGLAERLKSQEEAIPGKMHEEEASLV
jgi:uncharacterized integral membrane protein